MFNLRAELVRRGYTVSSVARLLSDIKGKKISPEGLNNKVRLNRLRVSEAEEILSAVGARIEVVDKTG